MTEVTGDLVVDDSRFDGERRAPGWTERHVPNFVGPLSALAVDANQARADPEYLAHPALGNLTAFRAALSRHGVHVGGEEAARSQLGSATSSPGSRWAGARAPWRTASSARRKRNVRAKTGSVRESRPLSGYLTTAGGRQVAFSLVLNSDPVPGAAIAAIDNLWR